MRARVIFVVSIVLSYRECYGEFSERTPINTTYKWPTVGISVLVRNKAYSLPYFFSCIYKLDYPKDRIYIWVHSDYNDDNSTEVVEQWAAVLGAEYARVELRRGPRGVGDPPARWTPQRFRHVIDLREEALAFAKKSWADFLFMVDADVYLTNPATLKTLVEKDLLVVAPMLDSDGLYSNFWAGMTEQYYYERTERYEALLAREESGCHAVPMVHSSMLLALRHTRSDALTWAPERAPRYDGPLDDIITFAVNARNHGIDLVVCNDAHYGWVQTPLEDSESEVEGAEWGALVAVLQAARVRGEPITPLPQLEPLAAAARPPRSKLGCDHIYMINLVRRPERRRLMELAFQDLGMEVEHVEAVDGRTLDLADLSRHSVTLLPGYRDPYYKRPMKAGEVGCFLSHHKVWEKVASAGLDVALVLEDDVRFAAQFVPRLRALLAELQGREWDLVYIGRKPLDADEERPVEGSALLVRPRYSYWTLGYLLSERGARRLLAARPLERMLPVDEFLPIMYDQHPNWEWKIAFPRRNLVALSASPLLLQPWRYTGQPGYVSDTEDSPLAANDHATTSRQDL